MDYFEGRYFGSVLGRFTSPDDGSDQDPSDPQSWNLYSYVRNSPLSNVDPNGQDCITVNSWSASGAQITTTLGTTQKTCTGIYVDGTVNTNSYQYDGQNLTFSFANDEASGSGIIGIRGNGSDDWGPGSSNALGARQIGITAPIGNALGVGTAAVLTAGAAGAAYGALAGGSALTSLAMPAASLPPAVSNPTLQNIVQKLFQESDVLPGGTAGAVRYELATGQLMSPSGHSMKAQEVITALTNLLEGGNLSLNDQLVSRKLIQDLSSALKTQPRR